MTDTENLGTPKQRQLNTAILQEYKGVYIDWYDLYKDLIKRGVTLEAICERFRILGTSVQIGTLNAWVKLRRKKEVAQ